MSPHLRPAALASLILAALVALWAPAARADTLEHILARQAGQAGLEIPPAPLPGQNPRDAAGAQLGELGWASDSDVWRALRSRTAPVTTQIRAPAAEVLQQQSGMTWLAARAGPIRIWGGWFMLGVLAALALFYAIRGRITLDGPVTGEKIERFNAIERFGHWLTASSFVLLAITGLLSLYGRPWLIDLLGHEAFSTIAIGAKWIHNNVAWAFILGLVMIFVQWVAANLPEKADLVWLAKGGGLLVRGVHPPAGKFNAGQKLVFWSVVILGASVSASGLSLLFPFEIPLFAKTFALLNATGLPQALGFGELPTVLAPQTEMQLAQGWHAIVAIVLIGIILGHIYIGTIGMEGAFAAMGDGMVELEWAREHHSLWVEQVTAAKGAEATAGRSANAGSGKG